MNGLALLNARGNMRALTVTAGAFFFVVLIWISAAGRMADSSAYNIRHFGGDAAAQTALDALGRNDPQTALVDAGRAVRTTPVDPAATSAYGSASLVLGRADQAYAAFAVAGALGWRDIHTQLFWLTQGLAGGDQNVVMERLDALLRLNSKDDAVANSLLLLEKTQLGQIALATLLAKHPPWEKRLLINTGDLDGPDLTARLATIEMAAQKDITFDCATIGVTANQLINNGEAVLARDLWRRACDRAGDLYLSDGNFEFDPAGASLNPFNWRLQRSGGLDVYIARGPGPLHGRALRIESSQTVRVVVARQLTALQPGSYQLSWSTALDTGKPDDSVTVLVQCNESKELTSDISGRNHANRVVVSFTVPAKGCPIQTIEIEKAASGLGETQTGWIDDIQIIPLGSGVKTAGER